MIRKLADNIISPLGSDTESNFRAVMAGESRLTRHEGVFGLPEPFCGSLLDREAVDALAVSELGPADGSTFFERLCLLSASLAVKAAGIDAGDADTLIVLSTTKGNVACLEESLDDPRCYLSHSVQVIADYFGNHNAPLVVSNACISGVCAQIAAIRALESGRYRRAVVTGADVLSKFIVSGFQSFKALSEEPCKPYDKDRTGLNLGEAAATMVVERVDSIGSDDWTCIGASNHNDANHISGPSRTGEGSYRVLRDLLTHVEASELAFVNAHGTATAYNDEMESIALHRAGLDVTPLTGLKGFYGHTLGAAGLLETILSMRAVDEGVILPTRGYENRGTTWAVNAADTLRSSDKRAFIKILSGFGGSNAGIAYRKGGRNVC